MPTKAKEFISFLEKELNTPVTMISTGPERKSLILKEIVTA